jgi:hypothetical protein
MSCALKSRPRASSIWPSTSGYAAVQRIRSRHEDVRNISSYVGSLVFTPQRMLGTLSSVPKLASRTIDQPWDAPHGHLSLHYKDSIPEDELMRLPRRSLAFDVPPEYVLRAVGVPARG